MLTFRDIADKPDACVWVTKSQPSRFVSFGVMTWTNRFFDFRNGEHDSTSYATYTHVYDGSISIDEYYANIEEGFEAVMEAFKEVVLSGQSALSIKDIRDVAKYSFLGYEKWLEDLKNVPF